MKKLSFLIFVLIISHATAQTFQPNSSPYLDSVIQQGMEIGHLPGLSACITKNGQISWIGSYGYANFGLNIPVDTSTLFMLASISKTITVTALLQLWEENLFELDDDINDYTPFEIRNPNYPNEPITFEMLCTHTSSIRDNWNIMPYYPGMDSPIPLGQYLYDYLNPNGANYFPNLNYYNEQPGESWHYCNNAVALMGYLIELIGDSTFSYQTSDRIFEPLQMDETAWFLSELDTMHIAMPYHWSGSSYTPWGFYGFSDYPAGSLYTSAEQLATFLMCYMNGGTFLGQQILQSTTVEMMLTPQVPQLNPEMGLIWFYYTSNGRELWGHDGGGPGVRTTISFCPEESTGVIVLSNGENATMVGLIQNLLYDYAEDSIITTSVPRTYPVLNSDLIELYPNPAKDVLTISFKNGATIEEVTIYNQVGQEVLQQEITEPTTTIDISTLLSGVYVVKVVGENGVQVGKFIKQ